MQNTFVASSSISIKAPVAKVWDALINPKIIKQYLFGTTAVSDWKVGSPIFYRGQWQGKTYEDKGIILDMEPEKLLKTTYWSSMTGKPDLPENYQIVSYIVESKGKETVLTVTQENVASEIERDHSGDNWNIVLGTIKKLLET